MREQVIALCWHISADALRLYVRGFQKHEGYEIDSFNRFCGNGLNAFLLEFLAENIELNLNAAHQVQRCLLAAASQIDKLAHEFLPTTQHCLASTHGLGSEALAFPSVQSLDGVRKITCPKCEGWRCSGCEFFRRSNFCAPKSLHSAGLRAGG